jgi:hypothetical protein
MTDLRCCNECIRAVAMIGPREGLGAETSFNVVARHPETGDGCVLCHRGPGVVEASDFVLEVLERRRGAIGFVAARADWKSDEDW